MAVTAEYVAGLFDGEGYVGCSYITRSGRQKTQRIISVQIGMTDVEPLEKVLEAVGFGNLNGPYNYTEGNKPHWKYSCVGPKRVSCFYNLIKEWISPRKNQQFLDAFIKYEEWAD